MTRPLPGVRTRHLQALKRSGCAETSTGALARPLASDGNGPQG
jgi:hypothetical protein